MYGMSLLPLGTMLSCGCDMEHHTVSSYASALRKINLRARIFFSSYLFLLESRLEDSFSYSNFFAKIWDIQWSSFNSTIPLFIQYDIVIGARSNFLELKQVYWTYCHFCKPNNTTREWQLCWTKQHALTQIKPPDTNTTKL